jgi:phosphohistidine phosphatase
MELLLLRHGIADDRTADVPDAKRKLTDEGVARTREAAAGLIRIAPKPQVILTSSKVRAAQTADIAGEAFGIKPESFDVLGWADVPAMLAALAERSESRIMIVGHEPDFSEMIETLVFGRTTGTIDLKKAGAALVEVAGRIDPARACGTLRWLATSKMLRRMA